MMENTQPTLANRLSFVVMLLLLAAFCFSAVSVVNASADDGGDQLVAKRDSGPGHDGDGEDDDDNSGPGGGDDDD